MTNGIRDNTWEALMYKTLIELFLGKEIGAQSRDGNGAFHPWGISKNGR